MASLLELRNSLAARGYSTTQSSANQLTLAPLITVHTHPLLSSPVVLIGANNDLALGYQELAVNNAIRRR